MKKHIMHEHASKFNKSKPESKVGKNLTKYTGLTLIDPFVLNEEALE